MSEWLTRVINENQAIVLGKDPEECLKKGLEKGQAIGLAKGLADDWAKAWAEGWVEGWVEGTVKTLAALVRKNGISLKEAAEQAEMSEAAFCEKAGLPLPQ